MAGERKQESARHQEVSNPSSVCNLVPFSRGSVSVGEPMLPSEERFSAGLWPVQLPDCLPVIPIPLRPPHGDARLDLQEILHRIYDAAGYEDYIYLGQPQPRLAQDRASWANQFVPHTS
jgi:hypothetical protein